MPKTLVRHLVRYVADDARTHGNAALAGVLLEAGNDDALLDVYTSLVPTRP